MLVLPYKEISLLGHLKLKGGDLRSGDDQVVRFVIVTGRNKGQILNENTHVFLFFSQFSNTQPLDQTSYYNNVAIS